MFQKLKKYARYYMRGYKRNVSKSNRFCFVISSPRSGSTWLKTALNHHPEISCTENRLFGQFFEVWPNNDGTQAPRITLDKYVTTLSEYYDHRAIGLSRDEFCNELMIEYITSLLRLSQRFSGKTIFVDKVTPYIDTSNLVIESIKHYLPEATIVQLVRDGRDVVTSGVFDWLMKNAHSKKRYAHFVEKKTDMTLERFFDDEDIELWTKYWTQPIEAIASLNENVFTIQYEDMQKNQEAVLIEFFKYVGVESSKKVAAKCVEESSFEKMSGGRKRGQEVATAKTRKGISGDWKNYFTRRDGELFNREAGKYLVEMGYEKDDSWIHNLPEALRLT